MKQQEGKSIKPTNMEISIIPTGGLCNRMRAISTGIDIARQYKSKAKIYWNNCKGLKTDFTDLFKPIDIEEVEFIENKKWLFDIRDTKTYFLRLPILYTKYDMLSFNYAPFLVKDPKREIHTLINTRKPKKLLIASCYQLGDLNDMDKIFVPIDEIQEKINEITNKFSKHTIGVHIRRTDNTASMENSPLYAFEQRMKEEIGKDSSTMFYLASDDEEVKRHFTNLYPGHVITFFDDISRNTIEGMRFAVVDLFCLSKTNNIIGSYYSSYSQVASVLGNIPIEYAGKMV